MAFRSIELSDDGGINALLEVSDKFLELAFIQKFPLHSEDSLNRHMDRGILEIGFTCPVCFLVILVSVNKVLTVGDLCPNGPY